MEQIERSRESSVESLEAEDPSLLRLETWPKFLGVSGLFLAAIVGSAWHWFHSPIWGFAVWGVLLAILPAYAILACCSMPRLPTAVTPPGLSDSEAPNDIQREFVRWDEEAKGLRDRRKLDAIASAILAPLAVLALSIQILAIKDRFWQAGFVGAELLIVLFSIRTTMGLFTRTHQLWIKARLRAELLRREHFLFQSRSGPYFGASREARIKIASQRVELITSQDPTSAQPLRMHAPKQDGPLESIDQNWLSSEITAYRQNRITDQRDGFYLPKQIRHRRLDVTYEGLTVLSIYLAAAMATFHLGVLLGTPNRTGPIEDAIDVAAIVLPPLGACFMALRASFENQRLRRTYAYHALQLNALDKDLVQVHDKLGESSADSDLQKCAQEFARLVLEVEGVLGAELTSWRLILESENPAG